MMTSIAAITERQHDLFTRIAHTIDNLKRGGKEKINRHSIDARLQLLESNWGKFVASHEKLVAARVEEKQDLPYFADELYQRCEDVYFSCKSELLLMMDDLPAPKTAALDASLSSTAPHCTRALPKIALPKFSGVYHE